ncbi:D-alanyl-D-alanine carboxypeptidase, partial [Streptomyces sp. SID4985]|nr:D-alanyl-D-alanine carboxypeptidase [Streptomyces sp. SID4985]
GKAAAADRASATGATGSSGLRVAEGAALTALLLGGGTWAVLRRRRGRTASAAAGVEVESGAEAAPATESTPVSKESKETESGGRHRR